LPSLRDYRSDRDEWSEAADRPLSSGGDEVEVSGTITSRARSLSGSGLEMELLDFVRPGEPDSLVKKDEPRSDDKITAGRVDDFAIIRRDEEASGFEATLTGQLLKLEIKEGALVLTFQADESDHSRDFAAYTTKIPFLDSLVDYRSKADAGAAGQGDRVRVTGVVKPRGYLETRKVYSWPLLELRSVEKVGSADSRAFVGHPRDPATIDESAALHPLLQAIRFEGGRKPELTFRGQFQSFSAGRVSLSQCDLPFKQAELLFPQASDSMFADYLVGDLVTVNGKLQNMNFSTPVFDGVSIVRDVNPASQITSQGRAIAPLDFSESKRIWNASKRRSREKPETAEILLAGQFDGVGQIGRNQVLKLKKLFLERSSYEGLELEFTGSAASQAFFDGLMEGDELLIEVRLMYRPPRRGRLADSSITPSLKWVARLTTPEEKVQLMPAKSNPLPTTSR
jgi:hypothetical protein